MSLRRVARRRLIIAGVSAITVAASVVGETPAGAAVSITAMTGRTDQPVRAGVTLTEGSVLINGWPQHIFELSVDLRSASIRTVLANNQLNSTGETIMQMVRRTGAVAGVNGDLFDLTANRSPYGGVVTNGALIKTPYVGVPDQFYVQSNGVAGIGVVSYSGQASYRKAVLTKAGRRTVTVSYPMLSVNNMTMAARGRLTLITPDIGHSAVPRGCAFAVLAPVKGGWKVISSSTSGSSLAGLAANRRALLACQSAGAWLHAVPRGTVLTLRGVLTAAGAPASLPIRTLIGGPRMLVMNGRPFTDTRSAFATYGRNPETWVCVDRTGRNVQLGALDGRDRTSRGVTLPELQAYLVSEHCYDGLVLDGGGSSAVAADLGGGPQIQDRPATGTSNLRPLADALLVY